MFVCGNTLLCLEFIPYLCGQGSLLGSLNLYRMLELNLDQICKTGTPSVVLEFWSQNLNYLLVLGKILLQRLILAPVSSWYMIHHKQQLVPGQREVSIMSLNVYILSESHLWTICFMSKLNFSELWGNFITVGTLVFTWIYITFYLYFYDCWTTFIRHSLNTNTTG